MNIVEKSHVKVYYFSGVQVEGIVKFWSDKEAILQSLTSDDLLLLNTDKDKIMMVRIVSKVKSEEKPEVKPDLAEIIEKADPAQLESREMDPYLRAKSLADLRVEQLKLHKQDIKTHLTSFEPSKAPTVNYATPFIKSAPPESPGRAGTNLARMRQLLGK